MDTEGIIVLNKHQMKNKELVKSFKQSGYKVVENQPVKTHECDGGDDYGLIDCFGCQKEMHKAFNNKNLE